MLRSSFLSLSSEFSGTGLTISSIQQFPYVFYRGVFSYSSLHLHHKYRVWVGQCIRSDILKMETKMREYPRTCHGVFFFIMLILWNQKRAAQLRRCPLRVLGKHSFRINISLWISVLLHEEELISSYCSGFPWILTTQGILFLISWWFSDVSLVLLSSLALVAAVHFLPGDRPMEHLSDRNIYFKTVV